MTEHKFDRKFVKDVLEVCNAGATTRASMQVAIIREMCLEALYGPYPGDMEHMTGVPDDRPWPPYDR